MTTTTRCTTLSCFACVLLVLGSAAAQPAPAPQSAGIVIGPPAAARWENVRALDRGMLVHVWVEGRPFRAHFHDADAETLTLQLGTNRVQYPRQAVLRVDRIIRMLPEREVKKRAILGGLVGGGLAFAGTEETGVVNGGAIVLVAAVAGAAVSAAAEALKRPHEYGLLVYNAPVPSP